jgi:hypothetical protein
MLGKPGLIDEQERYHLCLAEEATRDSRYLDFYTQRSREGANYVILDNGAYEYGRTPSLTLLAEVAVEMQPDEIVLPDVMHGDYCAHETVEESRRGAEYLREAGFEAFMAVPHGNTGKEWIACARHLLEIPGVRCLGIAEKDALKLSKGNRTALAMWLYSIDTPQIHLLGMMEDMADVKDPWVQENVRGVDGSKIIVWGMNGVDVTHQQFPKYPGRPKRYFDLPEPYPIPYHYLITHNIAYWRTYTASQVEV